jgi:predicted Zn-dependent peptidase
LDNGLEIVAECNAEAHSTALGFFVMAGSRDEDDTNAGMSHFLEHMMFKGTPTRSAEDVNREFDEIGAHYNARTDEESTIYYAAVLPEHQNRAVGLLADILRPSLRAEDFETEKQVILEEIRMYDDQPPFGADERCKAAFYGSHPLGHSVLGTAQSITNATVDAMRNYCRSRYAPGNIVLAVAGRVDFDSLAACTEKCCGEWEPVESSRTVEEPAPNQGFQMIHKPTATQQYALELARGPAADDQDRYAAKLLATVLGDDLGSRLYWELIDPGLAENADLSHYEYEKAGLMATYMSCRPDYTAENLQRILDVYRDAEAHGITEAELAQAKSKVRCRIVLSSERPRGRLFALGSDWIYRREYQSTADDLKAVAAVTLDDVAAVLDRYPLTRNTTVTIGPLAKAAPPK